MSSVHIQLGDPDRSGRARGGKILVDGHDIAQAVVGLNISSVIGRVPRVDLELNVHDVTTFEAPHAQVLLGGNTAEYLERAGWLPPPGVRSVLTRRADGCPCEWHEIWERPDHTMTNPGDEGAEKRAILGRTVPTCPVHGVNARRPDGQG